MSLCLSAFLSLAPLARIDLVSPKEQGRISATLSFFSSWQCERMIQPLISEVPFGSALSSFSFALYRLQKALGCTRLPTRLLLLLRGSWNAIPASLDAMEMGFQPWPQAVSLAVELGSLAALSLPSHLSSLAEPAAPAAGTVPSAQGAR